SSSSFSSAYGSWPAVLRMRIPGGRALPGPARTRRHEAAADLARHGRRVRSDGGVERRDELTLDLRAEPAERIVERALEVLPMHSLVETQQRPVGDEPGARAGEDRARRGDGTARRAHGRAARRRG